MAVVIPEPVRRAALEWPDGDSRRLAGAADATDRMAGAVAGTALATNRVSILSWTGPAADAFAERRHLLFRLGDAMSETLVEIGRSLRDLAGLLEGSQARIVESASQLVFLAEGADRDSARAAHDAAAARSAAEAAATSPGDVELVSAADRARNRAWESRARSRTSQRIYESELELGRREASSLVAEVRDLDRFVAARLAATEIFVPGIVRRRASFSTTGPRAALAAVARSGLDDAAALLGLVDREDVEDYMALVGLLEQAALAASEDPIYAQKLALGLGTAGVHALVNALRTHADLRGRGLGAELWPPVDMFTNAVVPLGEGRPSTMRRSRLFSPPVSRSPWRLSWRRAAWTARSPASAAAALIDPDDRLSEHFGPSMGHQLFGEGFDWFSRPSDVALAALTLDR